MTNDQFKAMIELMFKNPSQAAKALGMDRDTINSICEGKTRNGNDFPVPLRVELALEGYRARTERAAQHVMPNVNGMTGDGVQVYCNGAVRDITPENWFLHQTSEFENVRAAWPYAAALLVSVLIGAPARVDGSEWAQAT